MRLDAAKDEALIEELLRRLEQHPREGLAETPARVMRAWRFLTSGYNVVTSDVLKTFGDGAENYDEVVFVGNITFYSTCEHHLLPFFGVVHVGYIPCENKPRIAGLSKLARVVDIYARRLQCQERMTRQIAEALEDALHPRAIGVCARARHLCMESRGVQKPGTLTYTSALKGDFKNEEAARAEFLKLVQLADQRAVV